MQAFKKNLENAAKRAAKEVNDAAKKVAENEKFKSVAEQVKTKTKEIVESEEVKSFGETVLTAKNEHIDPFAKKLLSEAENLASGNNTKKKNHNDTDTHHRLRQQQKRDNNNNNNKIISSSNNKPATKIEVDADGDGDMSEITWTDGSISRLSSLRVFGKDTTIIAAVDDNNNNNNTSSSRPRSLMIEDGAKEEEKEKGCTLNNNNNNKVNLPILMFPGIASSGLYVDKSGLNNKKYKGRRLWMNAGFLAASAMGKTVLNAEEIKSHNNNNNNDKNEGNNTNNNNNNYYKREKSEDSIDDDDNDSDDNDNNININNNEMADIIGTEFAKSEAEYEIRSAWLYHIALDKNMVDERPGNRVRTYDGVRNLLYTVFMFLSCFRKLCCAVM